MKTVEMKLVKGGQIVLLDEDDFQRFGWLNWHVNENGYVVCTTPPMRRNLFACKMRLHRLIMTAPDGMDVDHINGNKLDNRKENLRICTRSENLANKLRGKATKYLKGAHYDKRRGNKPWFAVIGIPGSKPKRQKYLGGFNTQEEAHEAYVRASREMHGEFSAFKKEEAHAHILAEK